MLGEKARCGLRSATHCLLQNGWTEPSAAGTLWALSEMRPVEPCNRDRGARYGVEWGWVGPRAGQLRRVQARGGIGGMRVRVAPCV